jgi:hypothetical protein
MNKYQKAKIYTIRSPNTNKIYIGSTIADLSKRFYQHRIKSQSLVRNEALTSKIIIDSGDAYIELLENYPCNDKRELEKREHELIRENNNICVNKIILGGNDKTKEERRVKKKQYRDAKKQQKREKTELNLLEEEFNNI